MKLINIPLKKDWNRPLVKLLLLSLLNFSCEKFVDIKTNSSQDFIETVRDCQLVLDDYTSMNTGYPSDGEASADDYYLTDVSYLLTALSNTDRDLYTWSAGAIRPLALPQWQTPYKIVYNANLVLEKVEELRGSTDQATLDGLRGASLFFRAYSFWQVAQLYAQPYTSSNLQSPGIPLRLKSDINEISDRGTLEQTYSRIIQDLQEAVGLLAPTSTISSRPNKAAAYAMLARVYLSMEDYSQALTYAGLALQLNNQLLDYNTISQSAAVPFNPRFNKEVIFHSVMSPNPGLNPAAAGSNVAKIDPVLVASYTITDLRGLLYIKANTGTHAGSFRFTGNYEPVSNANLFNGLAVDEMLLIRAECYARAGNNVGAMADLNTLLRTRWVTGTYTNMTATTADEALGKILIERRKELLMRGLRWTDLRRLNHESRFAKTLSRTIGGTVYTLPPNDLRYTLLIPDEVILNAGITQNAR